MLRELIQALEPVLQSTAGDPPPQPTTPLGPIDTNAQRQAMGTLRTLLQNDDANAQRHFADHAALFDTLLGEHFTRVRNSINSLALDDALEVVESLPLPP